MHLLRLQILFSVLLPDIFLEGFCPQGSWQGEFCPERGLSGAFVPCLWCLCFDPETNGNQAMVAIINE